MPDFLLELLSEEIPARMQARAQADLARLFSEQVAAAGLTAAKIETYATPRRLALIARGLPAETAAVREEVKGPRAGAPAQALEGFLRKTGLAADQLEARDGILFAVLDKPGRATSQVLAEAIPAIVRAFAWPKSMRWGEASASPDSLRWVRPLQGIVALLGEEIVQFEIAGVESGAATLGHRFHHPGVITLGGAQDYAEKLRACHVIVDPAERQRIIAEGARKAAEAAGLTLVEDEGLVAENAGLTEWPVPLLGSFDPAYLDVPREVIQLTMRTNQKYFALLSPPRAPLGEGDHAEHGGGAAPPSALRAATSPSKLGEDRLAPHFVCVANIEASDRGEAIVAGNRRVLAARLADAKFFWEQDLKVPLEQQAEKLDRIVFHEKLGTVADKVERVAKLARWLVEEGIVKSSPSSLGEGDHAQHGGGARSGPTPPPSAGAAGPPPQDKLGEELADLATRAARLAKADLVTAMVGEFPELQGIVGGHLARAQGEPAEVADAVRDHYKPAGQGDEVPTAPATVAVSLADKLDTLVLFFAAAEKPSGSRDPFALRRSAISVIQVLLSNDLRCSIRDVCATAIGIAHEQLKKRGQALIDKGEARTAGTFMSTAVSEEGSELHRLEQFATALIGSLGTGLTPAGELPAVQSVVDFFADRLKVQQREAGVRHDLIDAVFALGGEDDLVRLLARVKALQAFVETPEGADLLAGYKRAANILRKEGWGAEGSPAKAGAQSESGLDPGLRREADSEQPANKTLPYTPEKEEAALIAALDSAEPKARAAVEAEDFEGAMAALAGLRAPVDSFFDKVTVNDPDPAKRAARLDLLARMRDAVHRVADFSRIEG